MTKKKTKALELTPEQANALMVMLESEIETIFEYGGIDPIADWEFADSDRMFDLCMHFVDGKVWVDVYECDWIGDNWHTNCTRSWTLTEEKTDG